jgi:hypothetical protein
MKYGILIDGEPLMEGPLNDLRPTTFDTLEEAEYWKSLHKEIEIYEIKS